MKNRAGQGGRFAMIGFVLLIVILVGSISGCGAPTVTATEPPHVIPETITPTDTPVDTPEVTPTKTPQAIATTAADARCDFLDGVWTCTLANERTVVFTGVPDKVEVWLIAFSETQLKDYPAAPLEGFVCLLSMPANIVFIRDGVLVTNFDTAVQMSFSYAQPEIDSLTASVCNGKYTESDFTPVYLAFDSAGNPTAWEKFSLAGGEVNVDTKTATLSFTLWGDQPIGWGVPK
jgi:hypothetical protein